MVSHYKGIEDIMNKNDDYIIYGRPISAIRHMKDTLNKQKNSDKSICMCINRDMQKSKLGNWMHYPTYKF